MELILQAGRSRSRDPIRYKIFIKLIFFLYILFICYMSFIVCI
jgi:hypothetical protein